MCTSVCCPEVYKRSSVAILSATHEPDEQVGGVGGAAAQEAVLQRRVQLRHPPDAERQVQRGDSLL